MTVRRALLAALCAVALLPGAASAAVQTSVDERWVCLGEPGKRPYCVTVWFPGQQ